MTKTLWFARVSIGLGQQLKEVQKKQGRPTEKCGALRLGGGGGASFTSLLPSGIAKRRKFARPSTCVNLIFG